MLDLADYMIDNKVYQYAYCSIFDDTIGQPVEETNNTNWCGGNGQMLAIGTDGRLFPCIRFMKYSLQDKSLPEFEIGDVNRGIESEEDNQFLCSLSCITRRSQSTDECWNCKVGEAALGVQDITTITLKHQTREPLLSAGCIKQEFLQIGITGIK